MSQLNEPLLELFRAHGVEAVPQDTWVAFPGRNMRANASIVREMKRQAGMTVQLDVRLEIAPGRTLVESCGGVGETRERAVADALHNFTVNSFHVLLAAFFRSDDQQVSREEWVIGGRTSRVTIGNVAVRGNPPVQDDQTVGWFQRFADRLKGKQLRPGTHWVRLYYAQMQRKTTACEVLLDNDVWAEMQSDVAVLDWPAQEEFYSVRVFLVIHVKNEGSVSPETAVGWLADIVAPRQEFSEDEVYAALADAGVPETLAERAYPFTQIAWGRAFLAGLGVRCSPEYVCFNASGNVVESGRLADEPCFAAASRLAARYTNAPGFRQLALMSADVDTVDKQIHEGSKPEDLAMTAAFLFLEAPTEAGMEKARQVIAQHTAGLLGPSTRSAKQESGVTKPWWRFWG